MSLSLGANTLAVCPGIVTSFVGSGGIEPYTYLVLPGGAGGTINSSGFYTAPAVIGDDPKLQSDVLQVTDSTGTTATATVFVGSALMLVLDIIRKEMGLEDRQVYLYEQKINIPKDSKIYIAVGVIQPRPFGNSIRFENGIAIQSINMRTMMSIDILSRSTEALNRKEEVLLAFKSVYAQQQMACNSFFVAPLSMGFQNLSQVDGPAIPYRFNLSVNLQYFVKKSKAVPYFDTFLSPTVTTEP